MLPPKKHSCLRRCAVFSGQLNIKKKNKEIKHNIKQKKIITFGCCVPKSFKYNTYYFIIETKYKKKKKTRTRTNKQTNKQSKSHENQILTKGTTSQSFCHSNILNIGIYLFLTKNDNNNNKNCLNKKKNNKTFFF
jgi:hypothetical protein